MEIIGEYNNCFICNNIKGRKIIAHHLSYVPEILVYVCTSCHRIFHNLNRFSEDKFDLVIEWIKKYGKEWENGEDKYQNSKYYKLITKRCNENSRASEKRSRKLDQTPKLTKIEEDRIRFIYSIASTMVDVHVDHIRLLSKGGLHHLDNLQILDGRLNEQKKNKWPLTEGEKVKLKGLRF